MKKVTYITLFMLLAGMYISTGAKAQVVIKIRPEWHEEVHVERPPAPGPRHIWVEGEWRWDRREHRYVHVPGYWIAPREGWVWVPGHWAAAPDGEEWHPGHWARRYY